MRFGTGVALLAACVVVQLGIWAWQGAGGSGAVSPLPAERAAVAAVGDEPAPLDARAQPLFEPPRLRAQAPAPRRQACDEIPTYTLAQAPPVPELPELEFDPLALTFFEPPYDDRRIPQAVALEAERFVREAAAGIDPTGEAALWLATRPEGYLHKVLASATLDSGLQLWVHVSRFPEAAYLDHGRALFFDPSTGVLARQTLALETRFSGSHPDQLAERFGQADLDLDGRRELVVREFEHNGTATNRWHQLVIELDAARRPVRRFTSIESSYVSWSGWNGDFRSRLIPAGALELWAQAWYEPRGGGEPLSLGHTVYRRASPGAPWEPAYQVINPDAPHHAGDGFATRGTARRPWREIQLASL